MTALIVSQIRRYILSMTFHARNLMWCHAPNVFGTVDMEKVS